MFVLKLCGKQNYLLKQINKCVKALYEYRISHNPLQTYKLR